MDSAEKIYFQTLEDGISKLPPEHRATAYRQCAQNCVKNSVLPTLRARFSDCGGDLDQFFSARFDNAYSFQRVMEKGHVYEFGYPKCFCPLVQSGLARSAGHCECSRESILYVLGELFPDKKFGVEILGTVLGGDEACRFRIVVEVND